MMTNEFLPLFTDYHTGNGSSQQRFNTKFDANLKEFLSKRDPKKAILLPSHQLGLLEENNDPSLQYTQLFFEYDLIINLPIMAPPNLSHMVKLIKGKRMDRLILQEKRYFSTPKTERPKVAKWITHCNKRGEDEGWYFEIVSSSDSRVSYEQEITDMYSVISSYTHVPHKPIRELQEFFYDFYSFLFSFMLNHRRSRYHVDERFACFFNMHRSFWLFFDLDKPNDIYNNLILITHIAANLYSMNPPLMMTVFLYVVPYLSQGQFSNELLSVMPFNVDPLEIIKQFTITEQSDIMWCTPKPILMSDDFESNLSRPQSGLLSMLMPERTDTTEEEITQKNVSYLETVAAGLGAVRDGSLKETTDQLNGLLSQLKDIMDRTNIGTPQVTNTLDQLKDLLDTEKWEKTGQKFLIQLFSGVVFCGATISAVNNRDKISISVCLISGIIFLYHTDSFMNSKMIVGISDVVTKIKNFLMNLNSSTPQSFVSDSPSIIKAVGTLFSMFVLKDTPISKLPEEIYRKISGWDRFTGNIHEIVMNLMTYVEWLYKYAQSIFFGESSQERWFSTHSPEVDEHIQKAESFLKKFHDGDMQETQFNFNQVSELIKENNSILMNCRLPSSKANDLRTVLNRFRMMLDVPFKKFSCADYNAQGLRVEPVFIVMFGGPGTLKSSTTKLAVHAILPYILSADELEAYKANPEAFVMFRKTHHTFWEALKNLTKVIIYDDGDQRIEVPGDPTSEPLEVIEVINNDTAPANMAFNDKGKRNIAPDLVFKTTNMLNPVLNTIHSHGAYYRRIDHGFIVYPKAEFVSAETEFNDKMERTFDLSKLPVDENGETVVDETMVWYQPIKYDKSFRAYEVGHPITFNEMVDRVKDTWALKRRQYEKLKSRINEVRNYHVNRAHESRPQSSDNVVDLGDLVYDLSTENGRYSTDFREFLNDFSDFSSSGEQRSIDELELMLDQKVIAAETSEYEENPDVITLNDEMEKAVNAFVRAIYKKEFITFLYLHMKRLFKVHNVWNVYSDVTQREIVASFYYRFGLKFNDVVLSQDADMARQFFLQVYQLYSPFTRAYINVKGTASDGLLAKTINMYGNFKSSIKEKMKGTWAERLWNSFEYLKKNSYMLEYLAVIGLIQLAFSQFLKHAVTPSIQKFQEEIKAAQVEIEIRRKMYDELRRTFIESKTVIDQINQAASSDELRLYKKILENVSKIPNSEWDDKLILIEDGKTKKLVTEPIVQDPSQNIEDMIETIDEYIKDYSEIDLPKTQPQSHGDGPRAKGRKYKNKRNLNPRLNLRLPSQPQVGNSADKNGEDIMQRILSHNFFGFAVETYPNSCEYEPLGCLIFVKGSIALFPDHFFDSIEKKIRGSKDFPAGMDPLRCRVRIRLDYQDTHQTQFFYLEDFCQADSHSVGEGKDLVLVNTPIKTADFSCRKTILKYIASREEHQNLAGLTAKFVSNRNGTIEKCLVRVQNEAVHYVTPDPSDPSTEYELYNGYKYYAPTSSGDCGGLVFIQKPTLPRSRLIGMHVAGSEKLSVGFSESLIREELEEAIALFDQSKMITEDFEEPSRPQACELVSNGQILPLYHTDQSAPMAFASDIRRSPLFNLFFYSKKIPAPLTPKFFNGVKVDPWNHNLKKMCINRGAIPQVYVDVICQQLFVDLLKNSPTTVQKFVLTPEEAFCGIENEPDSRSLPRNTGIGWPECLMKVPELPKRTRYTGKSQEGYDLENKYWLEALEIIHDLIDKMSKGIRDPENLCIDNVKDELLLRLDVLDKLKARVFSVLRFLYIIIDKMYLGQFSLWVMKNRIHNGIAIGVNVYSEEWHVIAKRLLSFGDGMMNIGAGDYSGYDGSHRGQVIRAIIEHVINKWYNDGNDMIRHTSGTYMFNAKHIRGNLVMEHFGGIPSGMFPTALMNCLINLFNLYYAWLKLHDFSYACLPKFNKHIKPVIQGDDNGYAVSSLYKNLFTEAFVGEAVKDLGYTYTPEHKNSPLADKLRNISDIEFLKRRFRYDQASRKYEAPLRLESLLEQVYWTKKGERSYRIICDKVDTVILELSLHGEEVFNKYVPTLVEASYERLDHYPITSNYLTAKSIIATRENFI